MTKSASSTAFDYESFVASKQEFNRNAFELETLAVARSEVNKIEVQQGFSWESVHLDVPAMVINIIDRSVKHINKDNTRKNLKNMVSNLTKTLNTMADKPVKSKIISENHISKWINEYFYSITTALVKSITLVRNQHKPGDEKSNIPSEHLSEYRIIQDDNEWVVTIKNKDARLICTVTMNGMPVNQEDVSVTTQWISSLFISVCMTKAYEEVLVFYKDLAHIDDENVRQAKNLAACIGGDYCDYLIIVDRFEYVRQSFASMPDELLKVKTDYTATVKAVLALEPDELETVIEIFTKTPAAQ